MMTNANITTMPHHSESPQQLAERLIGELIEQKAELGVQLAIIKQGRVVVDVAAGKFTSDTEQPVTRDTLFPVFSTGKGVAATAVHVLVERGLLDYDKPIAHYWPEFGANGKSQITLRHAMSHTAGVPQMPEGDASASADWDQMCRAIADFPALWEPGTRRQYHAITFGWLIGEPARRVDGRDFAKIVYDEVCTPLGMDDFYFGVPASEQSRVVILPEPENPVYPTPAADDPAHGRSIPPEVWPLETFINRIDIQRACIPASNAFSNALSVAWHYAGLDIANTTGKRMLSAESIHHATLPNLPTGEIGPGNTFGLGYALKGLAENPGQIFGHDGYGGSRGYLDTARNLAVGIARNQTLTSAAALHAAIEQIAARIAADTTV